MPSSDDTVRFVPLRELTDLARLVQSTRKAQRAYFKRRAELQKKKLTHLDANDELQAAMRLERQLDDAAREALDRERQTIPGMDSEGGDSA